MIKIVINQTDRLETFVEVFDESGKELIEGIDYEVVDETELENDLDEDEDWS